MITKENFDSNICEDYYCPNSKFYSKRVQGKGPILINMSINKENKINMKSFDRNIKPRNIINIANEVINCKDEILIDEDVISFFTRRSGGTVHGFTDIFDYLLQYFDNIDKYSNLKIILYKDATQGILDIVHHLCNINLIDKNKIIYLKDSKVYKFNSITFFDNKLHPLHHPDNDYFFNIFQEFLNKYYINKIKYLPTKYDVDNILLVKDRALKSVRDSSDGFYSNDINNFCKKFNYTRILPEELNEVELINILNNCKKLAVSWGTAHWKNIPYISDKCTQINVFVKGKVYKKNYSNYVSSDKILQMTNALKNYFDPSRTKYHDIENLNEIEYL